MDSRPPAVPASELQRHAAFLRRLARQLVGDAQAADDLVQETYLTALERPPTDQGGLRGWLATVLIRRAHNAKRSEGRRGAREARAAKREASASEVSEQLELQERLLQAVQRLPEAYKQVLYARFWSDLSAREIAQREGLPLGTVRTRIRRGLAQLREEMDRMAGGDRSQWFAGLAAFTLPRPASGFAAGSLLVGPSLFAGMSKKLGLLLLLLAVGWLGLRWMDSAEPRDSESTASVDPGPVASARHASGDDPEDARPEASAPGRVAAGVEEARSAGLGSLRVHVEASFAPGVQPAAGVGVVVERFLHQGDPSTARFLRTDDAGEVLLEALRPATYLVSCDRGVAGVFRVRADEVAEARLVLDDACVVEGRVLDDEQRPIAGASVSLLRRTEGPSSWRSARRVAETDRNGAFRIQAVPGSALLFARAERHATSPLYEVHGAPVASGTRTIEITLSASGAPWRGEVVDQDGEPVAGALVASGLMMHTGVTTPDGRVRGRTAWQFARCDAAGLFQLDGMDTQLDVVSVLAAGHGLWWGLVEAPDGEERIRVVLPPEGVVRGRVRAAEGLDVSNVRVDVTLPRDPFADQGPAHPAHFELPKPPVSQDGAFEIRGLPAGAVSMRASLRADGAILHDAATVSIAAGERHDVQLVLNDADNLLGTLVGPSGEPLAGWQIEAHPDGVENRRMSTLTDAEGRFAFASTSEPTYTLLATPSDVLGSPPLIRQEGVVPGQRVRLQAPLLPVGGAIRGRVEVPGGVAAADAGVSLEVVLERVGSFDEWRSGVESNAFRFSKLAAGRYRLTVERAGRKASAALPVTVREAESTDVGTIELPEPCSLTVVVDPASALEGDLRAALYDDGDFPAFHLALEGERFTAESLVPGTYRLLVRGPGFTAPVQPVTLGPGEARRVTIALTPSRFVRLWTKARPEFDRRDLVVRVWDASDTLWVERRSSRWSGQGRPGWLVALPPGSFRAELDVRGVGLYRTNVVVEETGPHMEKVELVLDEQ